MKELMHQAGIDTTTFKGTKQGFSIPEILQFPDWSQENTFIKFYYRPHFDPTYWESNLTKYHSGLICLKHALLNRFEYFEV
jgi:hypothetical protein